MRLGAENAREALWAGLALEGVLLAVSLFGLWFGGRGWPSAPSAGELWRGLLLALPLLGFNLILFALPERLSPLLTEVRTFQREFVLPLVSRFDWRAAFLISVSAGLGEEFFFRALLQPQLGIFISALLFALLHFGSTARRFKFVVLLYLLIGLYLGLVFEQSGSIWTVAVTHGAYDFLALLYLRYFAKRL